MNKNIHKKILEFVEQEQVSPTDIQLLENLHSILTRETLYWSLPPEKRKALNIFLRELSDEFTREIIAGDYGAGVVLESLVVTAFEVGWKLAKERETL
jgi:hypothetical protein